jgi:hypothetical protein
VGSAFGVIQRRATRWSAGGWPVSSLSMAWSRLLVSWLWVFLVVMAKVGARIGFMIDV